MESVKEHICYCLLFCFQKKSAADAHRIICETYSENVIALEWIRISLNDFVKNGDFDINNRDRSALQLWKRTNCGKMEKIVENDGKYFD